MVSVDDGRDDGGGKEADENKYCTAYTGLIFAEAIRRQDLVD